MSSTFSSESSKIADIKDVMVVHNDPSRIWVAVPLTEEAATVLKAGTSWYSHLKDEGNMWDSSRSEGDKFQYAEERGISLVLGLRGKNKEDRSRKLLIQIGRFDESSIFQDERGKPVTYDFVKSRWSELSGVMTWLLEQDARAFKFIPHELRTQKMYEDAVKRNPATFRYVPFKNTTNDMIMSAVSRNPFILKEVEEEFYSEELGIAAIRKDARAFRYVPSEKVTENLCAELMRVDPSRFGDIPRIPIDFRTNKVCLIAVSRSWKNLALVPRINITWEMSLAALRQDARAIELLPQNLLIQALAREDVKKLLIGNPDAFAKIPDDLRTQEIVLASLPTNGMALAYVKDMHRTEQMCKDAVENNALALEHVPVRYRTEAMYMAAVSQNGLAVRFIQEAITPQVALAAVKQTHLAWDILPEYAHNEYVRLEAVKTEAESKVSINSLKTTSKETKPTFSLPSFDKLKIPEMLSGLSDSINNSEVGPYEPNTPEMDIPEVSEETSNAISQALEKYNERPWYRKLF